MLILKQNAANTVPTPPAGKGTIFLNPNDDLSVKSADGNVTVFPTAAGANTQVYFNDDGSFGAVANLTFNKTTSVFTVTGNVAATNVLTDNLLYANGTAWDLSDPGGSNTQIQFNDEESFGGSAAFTFNKSSNLVSMGGALSVTGNANVGNIGATRGVFTNVAGEGGNISNIQGANVSGTVSSATTAGTVTTAAQPNITSVGTLTNLGVSGNAVISGNLTVDGNLVYVNVETLAVEDPIIQLQSGPNGAAPTSNSGKDVGTGLNYYDTQARVAFMGWDVSNAEFGMASQASIANEVVTFSSYGNLRVGNIIGNGQALTGLTGANVTGAVAFATTANAVAGANVSGTVSSATTAGTVTTNAQPNITSVGTLSSLAVTANVTAGNVYANSGTIGAQTLKGEGGNISNIQGANVSGTVATATTAGTVTTAAQPNITSVGTLTSVAVTGNVTAGNVYANSGTIGAQTLKGEGGNISNIQGGNVSGAVSSATTAGTVTTAAQPNITSVGTLSSLSVTGNVTGGNLNTSGNVNAPIIVSGGTGIYLSAGPSGYINFFTTGGDKASISDSGNIVASNLVANSTVFAVTANISSNVNAGNVYANSGTIGAQTLKGEGGNISNIQGANVSGAVASATSAGSATTAGTVTTAAQPNITSVGTLSSLSVTGNASAGNLNTAGKVVASTLESNVATGTAPFAVASTTRVANLNVAYANVSDLVNLENNGASQTFQLVFALNSGNAQLKTTDNYSINPANTYFGATSLGGTLTTAAQPNITSVGTLSSVAVTGNATAGNVYANSGTIGATNLTGTLTTAAQPNITSVGTLTSASVTGNVTAGNVYANSGTIGASLLTGTLTTAAQPNVTSVGTLTSLSVTGNVSAGNVSGTLLTGTLTTAAQPNITSVGTLTSATVTGNVAAGNLTTTGVLTVSGTGVSSIAGNLDMTSNTIINLATPTNANDAATKQYVDDIAQGLHTHDSCGAATPDTLANITGGTITYNNGASGVGANLVTTGTFNLIDGVNVQTAGTRILVKNEANSAHNGIYVWSNATVITRATDFDTSVEMAGGDFTFVTAGTLYDNTGWVMTDAVTTVGTSPVPWVQFSGAGTYTAGTGLTLNGSQFNISNTTVTAASYGNGDRVASFTVNAQGQLTAASNVVIAANAANLTGSTLASGITTSSLTTVGTLGTLNVSGNANVGNIGAAAGVFTTVAGSLTTAAQPNITSVGTLTSVAITGNATAGNVYANSGTIGATNLTGTLTTAAQPNITSVGTLTSVAITGNATAGNVYANSGTIGATNLTGTLTTAAQPNITSVGTLTGLGVNGTITGVNITANTGVFTGNGSGLSAIAGANVTGTVSSATTAGTVTTAAQPNITSVGTLTSLTSSGNISGANVISSAYSIVSVNDAVSANSTAQATGTALTKEFNVVSTANYLNNAVVLPAAVAGMRITVINTTASDILVYPAVNGRINSAAANVAYTHLKGTRLDYISTSTTQWYTLNATYG